MASGTPAGTPRQVYLDWARGIAVLLMIEAHTVDAWTRMADRKSHGFMWAGVFGGFAAPLFLWLAGVSLVLSASSTLRRSGSCRTAVEAVVFRGLQVFVFAFLFRLQAFVISPGSAPVTIFRVDILNVMGPAIAACALVWGLTSSRAAQVVLFSVAATALAMVTPIVRTLPIVDALPMWVQWHLRPFGDYTTFTAFPWTAFVFAGAALGVLVSAARDRATEWRLHRWLALVGIALIGLGFYTAYRPSIYAQSSFWSSSPTFFAIRLGILTLGLALLFMLSTLPRLTGALPWLERFGQHSLFIYWIHIELVYGYATWPLRKKLPYFWGWFIAYVLFTVAMYYAIDLQAWVVRAWRSRQQL